MYCKFKFFVVTTIAIGIAIGCGGTQSVGSNSNVTTGGTTGTITTGGTGGISTTGGSGTTGGSTGGGGISHEIPAEQAPLLVIAENDRIEIVNTQSGALDHTFNTPDVNDEHIAVIGHKIYLTDRKTNRLRVFDYDSKSEVQGYSLPNDGQYFDPVDLGDGRVAVVGDSVATINFYVVDLGSGLVTSTAIDTDLVNPKGRFMANERQAQHIGGGQLLLRLERTNGSSCMHSFRVNSDSTVSYDTFLWESQMASNLTTNFRGFAVARDGSLWIGDYGAKTIGNYTMMGGQLMETPPLTTTTSDRMSSVALGYDVFDHGDEVIFTNIRPAVAASYSRDGSSLKSTQMTFETAQNIDDMEVMYR